MAAWDFGPDPYTYERVAADLPWTGKRPVYVVRRGDRLLGVIVPVRINTDTRIAGTRPRRGRLMLVGRRRPGPARATSWRSTTDGAPAATRRSWSARRSSSSSLAAGAIWPAPQRRACVVWRYALR